MPDLQTRIVRRNSEVSPVGGLGLAGYIRGSGGVSDRPMRILGRYALVYLLHGLGIYKDANGIQQRVRPGDLIVVFPDLAHSYLPAPGERWDEFYVIFDGPVFDAWRRGGLLNPARPVMRLEPTAYWLWQLTAAAGTDDDRQSPLHEVARMQMFLADALSQQQPKRALRPADAEWLVNAKAILEREDVQSAEMAAEHLGAAYDTFRQKFARLSGQSPARFRARRQIERASELLADAKLNLQAIAQRCGFCDAFHFSKRFKQMTGISPSEYRLRLPKA